MSPLGGLFLLCWRLAGLVALPLLWLHPRSRPHIQGLLAPEPGRTWLHGASAGENIAASALASAMMPRPWRTHMSMRTPVQGTLPAPLDLPFVFSRWLDRARPCRLILIESELWPGWIAACRARGIPIAVVGSRESRGSRRWRWIPGLWSWLSQDLVFLSQADIGDLKTRAPQPEAPFELGRESFIAASTRQGDEGRILEAWDRIESPPLLVLAPRRLERVAQIRALLEGRGLQFGLRSENPDIGVLDVLLLDSMGELAGLFPQARAAFIGGSFDPSIGGHSPAEAFRSGLPVVAGPCRDSNPAAWKEGYSETVSGEDGVAGLTSAIEAVLERGPSPVRSGPSLETVLERLPPPRTPRSRMERPWLIPLVPFWVGLSPRPKGNQGVNCPVISVGGLTAGGSGKTPVVAWLASRLEGAWVLSRGHGRKASGPPQRLGRPDRPPEHDLGDELEMLRRSGIPVVSSPDRVAGAQLARSQGARFILLDDGFQNRLLPRNVDIVCIDRRWPRGRGSIPVGTSREPWESLERADWLWLHHDEPVGCPMPETPKLPRIRSRMRPVGWRIRGKQEPLSAVQGAVDVVVGIARPEGFLCTLLDLGLELRSVVILRDHGPIHSLLPGSVMTEKDAARLPPDADIRALRTELEVEGAEPLLAEINALEAS